MAAIPAASSGRDVPPAIMVMAITASLTFRDLAISDAPSRVKFAPKISPASPIEIFDIWINQLNFSFDSVSSGESSSLDEVLE